MVNLTGQKFGKLTAISISHKDKRLGAFWICLCDCGRNTVVYRGHLKSGHTKSCGCLWSKHGHTTGYERTKTYYTWVSMRQRCDNPSNGVYGNYGGRGIKVCSRWMIFENFLEDMGESPTGLQLDRIDNDGDYCKENCRWVTPEQNSRNKRDNRFLTLNGETKCVAEWAEELCINSQTLYVRLFRGWSAEKALTTPAKTKKGKSC